MINSMFFLITILETKGGKFIDGGSSEVSQKSIRQKCIGLVPSFSSFRALGLARQMKLGDRYITMMFIKCFKTEKDIVINEGKLINKLTELHVTGWRIRYPSLEYF